MSIKDGLGDCVARRISAIVVRRDEIDPTESVFLVFDDGTYYELYGRISSASEVRTGDLEKVLEYAEILGGEVNWFVPNPDGLVEE